MCAAPLVPICELFILLNSSFAKPKIQQGYQKTLERDFFSFLPKLDFSETLFFDKKVKILFHFFQQKIEVEKNHSNEVLSQFLRMLIASRER